MTAEDKLAERPEPLFKGLLDVLELVGLTDATEPIVADGAGPSTPFIASDSEESCAKPTDAGLER